MGEDALPASWQLGVLLGWGFLLFNQSLFAGMEAMMLGRGDLGSASKFALATLACGVIVFCFSGFLFAAARPKRAADGWFVSLATGLGMGLILATSIRAHLLFAGVNLLIALWLARGLLPFSSSKKREKG